MAPAYVLTEDDAAAAGIAGVGPYAFAGIPGVYIIGEPVALAELGGRTEAEMDELLDGADVPISKTTVAEGEGRAYQVNHWTPEMQVAQAEEAAGVETIRTHADADAVAAELGIAWPEGSKLTVAEKVASIDEVRAGAATAGGAE